MPTDDERREVAAKLMELAEGNAAVECSKVAHALGLEYEVHGCIAAFGRADVTALADFIDPTCTVVSERAHTVGFGCEEAGTEFTLSCGHTVIVDGELPPRYCDECGARVVDEDAD